MAKVDIKALAAASIGSFKETVADLSRLKGWNLKSVAGVINVAAAAVKKTEEVGLVEGIKGADKQALACELILQVVPLPWYLRGIVSSLLPILIDRMVDALKDRFGKA